MKIRKYYRPRRNNVNVVKIAEPGAGCCGDCWFWEEIPFHGGEGYCWKQKNSIKKMATEPCNVNEEGDIK